ncbi:Dedicator of cytokinesis protein 3, partial [Xenoophorus captivus]
EIGCNICICVLSFPDIFDELLQMFTVQEVAEYVRGTLGSMPSTVDIGQSMDVVKLQSIARTVESRLFFFPGKMNMNKLETFLTHNDLVCTQNIFDVILAFFASLSVSSESRSILLPVVLHHIHLHLRQQRELLICSGILSSIFSIIKTSSMVQYSVLWP